MAFPNYKTQGLGQLLAGEDLQNDVLKTEDRSTYTNTGVSALIKTGAGRLKGIMLNSGAAAATIIVADSTTTTTPAITTTWTITATTIFPAFIPFPDVEFSTGLYVTITGTTDITVFWK